MFRRYDIESSILSNIDSWNEAKVHYALIEMIEIKMWPYCDAYGQSFFLLLSVRCNYKLNLETLSEIAIVLEFDIIDLT